MKCSREQLLCFYYDWIWNIEYRIQKCNIYWNAVKFLRRTPSKYPAGPESLKLSRAPKTTCTTSSKTPVQAAAKVGPALEDNEKVNSQLWSKM